MQGMGERDGGATRAGDAVTDLKRPGKRKLAPVPAGPPLERVVGVLYDGEKVSPCLANAQLLLSARYPPAKTWTWDEFSQRYMVRGAKGDRQLEEQDEIAACTWLQRSWSARFGLLTTQTAVQAIALEQRTDMLIEHVRAVRWDGEPRVDGWAVRYLGAEDTPYHREVGRVLLLSLAARALRPGCKVDTVPVLEGGQGKRKSTVVAVLGGGFFAELEATAGTQAAAEQLAGAWCVEIGELDGLSRAEVNAIKAFITRRDDRFRRAYARFVTTVPRRSVMIGTTNAEEYLDDPTGARRFLPIACGELDAEGLREVRDQLIAEAVHRVDAGEPWWTVDASLVEAQKAATDERRKVDPWEARVVTYVQHLTSVMSHEVLDHLGVEVAHRAGFHAQRVAKLLKFLGFNRVRVGPRGARTWVYVRETSSGVAGGVPASGGGVPASGAGSGPHFGAENSMVSQVSHVSQGGAHVHAQARAPGGSPEVGGCTGTLGHAGTRADDLLGWLDGEDEP